MILMLAVICGLAASAGAMDLYYTNRTFTVVNFNLPYNPPVDLLNSESAKLTEIVKGEPVTTNSTETYVIEKEAIAIGYSNSTAAQAWSTAVGALQQVRQYPGEIKDHVGWVRGTREEDGKWGAYFWTAQNRIAFQSSATNWWTTEDGVPVAISNVLVGTLGDYQPMTDVVDLGPDISMATNFPGENDGDEGDYGVDITNVYYELVIPYIWITPRSAVTGVGGSNAQFTVTGSNIPSGVTWTLSPTNFAGHAEFQTAANYYALVTPGTVATNYKVRATSVDNTNFYDEVPLTVYKVDIVETNVYIAVTNTTTLHLTPDSNTNVQWEITPDIQGGASIEGSAVGTSIVFNAGSIATNYTLRAYAVNYTNCYNTCTVSVLKVDIAETHVYALANATGVVFHLTPASSTNVQWEITPELQNGAGIEGNSNGTGIVVSAGSILADYTIRAYAVKLTNCENSAALTVVKEFRGEEEINPEPSIACTIEPINTMSGDNSFNENDLRIPCPGLSLEFVRRYNSAQESEGACGKGWTHTYEWRLTALMNPFAEPTNEWMVLRTDEGREFKFPKQGATYGPCAENNLELETSGEGYTVTLPAGVVYSFNTNGTLTGIKDAWNNQLTLSYSDGKLTQVAHGNGQVLNFTYDGTGRLTNVWAAANLMVGFGYDGNGRLTTATRHVGNQIFPTSYEYNNDSAITRRTNARNDAGEYGYTTNASGAALKGSSLNVGGYYTHTLSYDTNKTTVTYTRGGVNQVLDYYYNPDTLRLYEVDGPGDHQVGYQYDNNDNITNETVSAPSLNESLITWRQYDTNHNVTQSSAGYNATPSDTWTFAWHANYQLPTQVTDPEGNKVGFEYQNGAISRVKAYYTANDSYDTVFTYATNGLLTQVATPNGATISYTYDAYGYPASVTPSAGPALTYQYNQLGHLEQMSWPDNRHIHYESDAQGWVKSITYPDNSTETFNYDGIGNLTNHVDQAGRTTRMTYLPTRKLSSASRMLDEQSVGITYEYDQQMNSLCIRDALNRAVEGYQLDIHDRPVSITNIEGQVMTVAYGLESFVKSVTRFDGTTVSNGYDGAGRLTQISYPDAALTFDYYADGMVKSVTDSVGTVSNVYNTLNRLTWTKGVTPSSEVSYGYFAAGQVSAVTSVAGTVSCTLDAGDRLSSISSPAGTFNYSYNANNGLISGVSCSAISMAHTFNVLDRVTDITWRDSSNNVVKSFAYDYNAVGIITNVARQDSSHTEYTYDGLDRLISETSVGSVTSVVSYAYDLVGNRTQTVVNGQTINYTLSANRLTSWGTNSQQKFDLAGNVTNIQYDNGRQLALIWDSRYRVTSVYTNGNLAESYGYDALGRRISISDGSTTRYLIYDGIHCVAETDSGGNLLKSYTYGPGIDNLLSMTVYGGTTSTYYYVKDHLGSVLALTDSSGTIVESYQYDAWGNTSVFDGSGNPLTQSAIGNRYCWQGREYSWVTRLYYFRARWYDPVTGRWLSNDPIGISGGLNQYAALNDNTVNFTDPSGEIVLPLTIAIAAVTLYFIGEEYAGGPGTDECGAGNYAYGQGMANMFVSAVAGVGVSAALNKVFRIVKAVVAKTPGVKYIGKLDDLKGIPRSQTLLDDLPDLGSAKANYYQNSSVLRKVLRDGYEIRDASAYRPNWSPDPTLLRPDRTVGQSFLGAERNILDNKGLMLDSSGAYVPR